MFDLLAQDVFVPDLAIIDSLLEAIICNAFCYEIARPFSDSTFLVNIVTQVVELSGNLCIS